jgi:5'-methylthioadenosine phosphorylase
MDDVREVEVKTPYGATSDVISIGRLGDVEVAFIPRHGRGHRFTPSEVPYRANIWALKSLGVSRIFSASAVGSMKEEVLLAKPVLVDQFIDRTCNRQSTFFGDGIVAHVSMAQSTCPALRGLLQSTAKELDIDVIEKGTYVCIEGPQFSSRAESFMYRDIGVDVIGMTNATEAKLAREAEICYATIAIPTDYDCWHETHDAVSVETVVATLSRGIGKARDLIAKTIVNIDKIGSCSCGDALANAIMTDHKRIPDAAKTRLAPIVGRYLDLDK